MIVAKKRTKVKRDLVGVTSRQLAWKERGVSIVADAFIFQGRRHIDTDGSARTRKHGRALVY